MQAGLLPLPSLLTRITPPQRGDKDTRKHNDNRSHQKPREFNARPREPGSSVIFHKSGMLYLIPEDKADEQFYDTLAFVYKPEGRLTKEVIESRTRMARCYIQHKKYGCTYPPEIMAEIERMKE